MNTDTITQLIRIIAYAGGSYFLGDAVANGEMFTAAVAGLVSVVAFIWWMIKEKNKVA